jgi:REP element-mobilizing transposase RayT
MSNDRYRNVYLDGCSHFCTASVVNGLPVLQGDQICRFVLDSWRRQRERYGVKVDGFVIMPDHEHVLVSGSADGVRKFMQYSLAETSRGIQRILEARAASGDALAGTYLRVFRSKANGAGQGKVWKERFRAFPIDRERDLLVKLTYIHNNPVRRGLVDEPGDWSWSSYGFYHGGQCPFPVDAVVITASG